MANCPVCGLRMVVHLNTDMAECPEHGRISGLTMLQLSDKRGWQALIEMRAGQAYLWLDSLRTADGRG